MNAKEELSKVLKENKDLKEKIDKMKSNKESTDLDKDTQTTPSGPEGKGAVSTPADVAQDDMSQKYEEAEELDKDTQADPSQEVGAGATAEPDGASQDDMTDKYPKDSAKSEQNGEGEEEKPKEEQAPEGEEKPKEEQAPEGEEKPKEEQAPNDEEEKPKEEQAPNEDKEPETVTKEMYEKDMGDVTDVLQKVMKEIENIKAQLAGNEEEEEKPMPPVAESLDISTIIGDGSKKESTQEFSSAINEIMKPKR